VSSSPDSSSLKRLARKVARPVTSPIDGRVADINRRVEGAGQRAQGVGDRVDELGRNLTEQLGSLAKSTTEATSYVGLELRRLVDGIQELSADALEDRYRERLEAARNMRLEGLDAHLAALINIATGHTGFAAQAELWFNQPVAVELTAGDARLSAVNERIVEVPFAMSALARLSPGARVLDIGSAESTLPLSLASLGYQVTSIDPRPLPYAHPNLTSVASRLEEYPVPEDPYAAVFLISTIEHVGLPAYGLPLYGDGEPGHGADRDFVNRVGEMLAPEGVLVLTTPYGVRAVDEFQRTYDDAALSALLEGWDVVERRVVTRRDKLVWMAETDGPSDRPGVVMVLATLA
jgi:hypothetical protein